MRLRRLSSLSLVAACAVKSGHRPPSNSPIDSVPNDSTWIVREPVICGEVRGRVLDQAGQRPMADAYVTLDSSSRGVMTDSLGRFRVSLPRTAASSVLTRPTFLRIRRVGAMEIRVLLPSDFGYVVEVQIPSLGLHMDHLATLRIKSPGFCAGAT